MIHTDKRNDDRRRYNQPTSNKVAYIFKSVDGDPPGNRENVAKLIVPSENESLGENDINESNVRSSVEFVCDATEKNCRLYVYFSSISLKTLISLLVLEFLVLAINFLGGTFVI